MNIALASAEQLFLFSTQMCFWGYDILARNAVTIPSSEFWKTLPAHTNADAIKLLNVGFSGRKVNLLKLSWRHQKINKDDGSSEDRKFIIKLQNTIVCRTNFKQFITHNAVITKI